MQESHRRSVQRALCVSLGRRVDPWRLEEGQCFQSVVAKLMPHSGHSASLEPSTKRGAWSEPVALLRSVPAPRRPPVTASDRRLRPRLEPNGPKSRDGSASRSRLIRRRCSTRSRTRTAISYPVIGTRPTSQIDCGSSRNLNASGDRCLCRRLGPWKQKT